MSFDTTLFPELPQSPLARPYVVKNLVFEEVQKGRIRVPEFQRKLRWRAQENAALFDSLWRGYPIGSLLFWKRPAEAGVVRVGGAKLPVAAAPDAKWVVDGQQRITALAAAMLDLPDQSPEYRVHFDPRKGEFFVPLRPGDQRPDAIAVSVLADVKKLNRWLRERDDLPEEIQDLLDTVHGRIVEYNIPTYEVDTPDEAPLRAIFSRLNSTGARMQAHEVFNALLGQASGQREPMRLDALVEEVRLADFGELERAEALKCLLGASGLDPTSRPEKLDDSQLKRLIPTEEAANAIRLAVEFLQKEVKIPHLRLVPYPVALILLTRFFRVHRLVEEADSVRLARWVWRGAATGLHQRAEVSRMREALRDIREGETPTATIDRLLKRIRRGAPGEWKPGHFDIRSAATRVELLAMLELAPRKMPVLAWEQDGGECTLRELLGAERLAPEIYRLSSLKEYGEEVREQGRTAANRILISGPWSGAANTLRKLEPARHKAFLDSHLIGPAALDALHREDPAAFLKERSRAVVQRVEEFLETRAGWDEPELAPIEAYLDER